MLIIINGLWLFVCFLLKGYTLSQGSLWKRKDPLYKTRLPNFGALTSMWVAFLSLFPLVRMAEKAVKVEETNASASPNTSTNETGPSDEELVRGLTRVNSCWIRRDLNRLSACVLGHLLTFDYLFLCVLYSLLR